MAIGSTFPDPSGTLCFRWLGTCKSLDLAGVKSARLKTPYTQKLLRREKIQGGFDVRFLLLERSNYDQTQLGRAR